VALQLDLIDLGSERSMHSQRYLCERKGQGALFVMSLFSGSGTGSCSGRWVKPFSGTGCFPSLLPWHYLVQTKDAFRPVDLTVHIKDLFLKSLLVLVNLQDSLKHVRYLVFVALQGIGKYV
jgi:hypothetical protein